jgi:hypothetical protein
VGKIFFEPFQDQPDPRPNRAPGAGQGAAASGRDEAGDEIEQDRDRAEHEDAEDPGQADERHVGAGLVGEAGADAHHFAVGFVEGERAVHGHFLH